MKAEEVREKTPTEVRLVSVDMSGKLDDGELLTGTPTAASAGLTISNIIVSTEALTLTNKRGKKIQVATARAIQFLVSGGTDGTTYTINVSSSTDSTPAQTVEIDLDLRVAA